MEDEAPQPTNERYSPEEADEPSRPSPRGGAFEWVSCPNYSFEVASWIWAKQRHQRYRSESDGRDGHDLYPIDREALIPFLL